MAKKTTKKTTEKKARTTSAGPRWSIGLFKNDKGKLVTVYVKTDGTPMPYEMKRVGSHKILFHNTYSGMKYSEARQELLKEAAKKGIKADAQPKAEKAKKAPAAKAKKASGKKATKRASKPKKEEPAAAEASADEA